MSHTCFLLHELYFIILLSHRLEETIFFCTMFAFLTRFSMWMSCLAMIERLSLMSLFEKVFWQSIYKHDLKGFLTLSLSCSWGKVQDRLCLPQIPLVLKCLQAPHNFPYNWVWLLFKYCLNLTFISSMKCRFRFFLCLHCRKCKANGLKVKLKQGCTQFCCILLNFS